MALNRDQYRLSDAEHQDIFERYIKPILFGNVLRNDKPIAVVFGGQPGAGKSRALDDALDALQARGGAAQIIGDDLRSYHPHFSRLMKTDDKTAAFYTDRDTGLWVEKAIAYAKEQRYNLVIEGTMRDSHKVAETLQGLRVAGYETDVRVLAVNVRFSQQGILQRYEKQKSLRGYGRMTTDAAHQAAYDGMPITLERIEREKLADQVTLYQRGGVVLYSNSLQNSEWVRPPQALQTLEQERNRPMRLDELHSYVEGFDQLALLVSRPERQADSDELKHFEALHQQAKRELEIAQVALHNPTKDTVHMDKRPARQKTLNEPHRPLHELVAEKLIEQLKAGTSPWQKPWDPSLLSAFAAPYNALTGSRYRGGNALWLMLNSQHYNDPRWLTFKQAKALGAHVRQGERSTLIQYYKTTEQKVKLDEQGNPIKDAYGKAVKTTVLLDKPRLFSANVFNAAQVDGLPPLNKSVRHESEVLKRAEHVLMASGAQIEHHDTGSFGSAHYAREKLRAEIASLMLGEELGIGHDFGRHAVYVEAWIDVLESDPMEIMRAASDAEHIRTYLMDFVPKRVSQTELDVIAADIFAEQPSEEEQVERLAYRIALETAQVYRREHPSTVESSVDNVLAQVDYLQQFVDQQPANALAVVRQWNENPRAYAAIAEVSIEMIGRYSTVVATSTELYYQSKLDAFGVDKKGYEGVIFNMDDMHTLAGNPPLSWAFAVNDHGSISTLFLNSQNEIVILDTAEQHLSYDALLSLYTSMTQNPEWFMISMKSEREQIKEEAAPQSEIDSHDLSNKMMTDRVNRMYEALREENIDGTSIDQHFINSENDCTTFEHISVPISSTETQHTISINIGTADGEIQHHADDDFSSSPADFVHNTLHDFEVKKALWREKKIHEILDGGLAPLKQLQIEEPHMLDQLRQGLYEHVTELGLHMAQSSTQSRFVSNACCHIANSRIAPVYASAMLLELEKPSFDVREINSVLARVDTQVRNQVDTIIAEDINNRLTPITDGNHTHENEENTLSFS